MAVLLEDITISLMIDSYNLSASIWLLVLWILTAKSAKLVINTVLDISISTSVISKAPPAYRKLAKPVLLIAAESDVGKD